MNTIAVFLTDGRRAHLLFLMLTLGCTRYWQQTSLPEPTKPTRHVKVYGNVQVFSHGQVLEWQAVTVSRDSVTGIPADSSAKCDSCRRALPRADVDSVRLNMLSKGERAFWRSILVVVGAYALYLEATTPPCGVTHGKQPCT